MRPAASLDFLQVDRQVERFLQQARLEADPRAWQAEFWHRFMHGPFPAAYVAEGATVLIGGTPGHRIVEFHAGDGWERALELLAADDRVQAISIPSWRIPELPDSPPAPGFRRVTRLEHRFDLRFAPPTIGPPPPGYEVEPYDPARRQEVAALLSAVNQGLDGLFLTYPELPAQSTLAVVLERLEAGAIGEFLPGVSFLASRRGQLVGLTLGVRQSPAETLLFEIAVRLRHRGSGLAPYLIARLEHELARQGASWILFATSDTHRGANALFDPAHARTAVAGSVWIWLRGST